MMDESQAEMECEVVCLMKKLDCLQIDLSRSNELMCKTKTIMTETDKKIELTKTEIVKLQCQKDQLRHEIDSLRQDIEKSQTTLLNTQMRIKCSEQKLGEMR